MVAIFPPSQRQTSKLEQSQQLAEGQERATAERPWWRHPIAGYAFAFPVVAAFAGITLLGENMLETYYFPSSASLLIAILCVALVWGVGPGLLAMVLSDLAQFYFYAVPVEKINQAHPPLNWEIVVPVLLFALAGLVVALLTGQREAARRRALLAEQTEQVRASDLGRINQELLQANQLKDLFVSVASHELKTPITTIRGQTQLALRRIDKTLRASKDLDGIRGAFIKVEEQTQRVVMLLNDLLDLTSLRSGKQTLEQRTQDFSKICVEAVEEQRQISKRTIELKHPVAPVLLQGDATRLGQVVTNLVNNALKYSSPESVVLVNLAYDERAACFSVQDAGKGISPEQQTHIFEPFYRTSEARASTVSGTGLGLAICKDIVEQHKGRIWCTSQPDRGSTFFVELPLPR